MDVSRVMNKYETKLARMIEKMAGQIISGARSRVLRNLKIAKDKSPLAESIRAEKAPDGSMSVFTDIPYARYVEFGTIKQPAQPFLTPAAEEVKVTFSNFYEG